MPESWLEEVDEYWSNKEHFLRSDPSSPLKPDDRKKFQGLRCFKPDPTFKLKAKFSRAYESKEFELKTSKGNSMKLSIAGELYFRINEIELKLLAFKGKGSNLFIPFCDKTNGSETYKLGRYVDVEAPEGVENVTIDFNLAYNPDCAYNSSIESLIPPPENVLSIPIKAGEMNYVK